MASEAGNIIKNMPVQVTMEIVTEVVYVLKGVYHIGRMEIGQCLLDFLAEVNTTEPDVLKLGVVICEPVFRKLLYLYKCC